MHVETKHPLLFSVVAEYQPGEIGLVRRVHEGLHYIYIYMLGTDVKPQARFKAVRTVLKPSGRL